MSIIIKRILFSTLVVILVTAGFGAGAWFGVNKIAYHVEQPGTIDFSLFWDAYNTLSQNFIDPSKIDNQKIIYGAIQGMTSSLGDPYTDFFDPSHAQRFQQDLSGSFEGIGVEIGIKKDTLTVVAPLAGTPGEKAGLKPGDLILKIDGKDAYGMTTDEAVSLIRGKKGTIVTLNMARDSWPTAKDIKITRDTIIVPTMKWEIKNGNIAYIKLNEFGETLPLDFQTSALEILQSPAKKIVLDLRGNPGGYLEVAQNVAGWLLKQGQTVTIEDFGKGKAQQIYKAQGNADLVNYPIVVLIDEGSASASEILAGALRDNRNVKLIGAKSFGKGSVQEVIDLRGGSFLKITIAKWLTPKGNSISEVGLDPDVKVEITDADISAKKDPQLDKALEIIGGLK
jgi:carboxyl-terminal processing protease